MRWLSTIALVSAAQLALCHPSEAWVEQAYVLEKWADAVSRLDNPAIARYTAAGQTPFQNSPATTITAAYATFTDVDDTSADAEPVVLSTDLGSFLSAW